MAEGENMRLALIAILLSLAIAIGIYTVSQDQRTKMIAAFRKNKRTTAEKILLTVFSYAFLSICFCMLIVARNGRRSNEFARGISMRRFRGRPLTTQAVLGRTLLVVVLVFACALMAWLVYGNST